MSPVWLIYLKSTHFALCKNKQTLPEQPARLRLTSGTREVSLNAAAFPPWHGSWIPVAKGPSVNTTYSGQLHPLLPGAKYNSCYSGLQVQGTADSPAAWRLNYISKMLFCQCRNTYEVPKFIFYALGYAIERVLSMSRKGIKDIRILKMGKLKAPESWNLFIFYVK